MSDNKSTPEPSMDEILASIRRILAEDGRADTHPVPRALAARDVLDLTEALEEDGSVRHISPFKVAPPTPLPDGRIEPAAPRPEGDAATPRLVSDASAQAIAGAFVRLSNASREGERPIDELVQATLRPLLQIWLDQNLPQLVERLVRAEIARVVGDAGPR